MTDKLRLDEIVDTWRGQPGPCLDEGDLIQLFPNKKREDPQLAGLGQGRSTHDEVEKPAEFTKMERKTIALAGYYNFGDPANGKEGDHLGRSKYALGQMVRINRPGMRKDFQIRHITTYDGETYVYDCYSTTGGSRGSEMSGVQEKDIRPSTEAASIPEPIWMPKRGEKVVVSHLNFEVEDTVIDVKKEQGRWKLYLKNTNPMPGSKAAASWDGRDWVSGRYGSPMNGFSVEKWTGRALKNDID